MGFKKFFRQTEKHFVRPAAHAVHHLGHQIEQEIRSPVKVLAPIVGAIAGNVVGGPLGGVIGGGIGRAAVNHNHASFGRNLMQGAGIGASVAYGAPLIGKALGIGAGSPMGGMLGMARAHELPFANMLGLGSTGGAHSIAGGLAHQGAISGGGMLAGLGKGLPSMGLPLMQGQVGTEGREPRGMGANLFSMLGGEKQEYSPYGKPISNNPLESIASHLGTNPLDLMAALGAILGKKKLRPEDEQKSIEKLMEEAGYGPNAKVMKAKVPRLVQRTPNTRAGDYEFFENINAPYEYHYAKGGYVHGDDSGQSDGIPAKLEPGEFILNATDMSLMGDGNSHAGAKRWEEFERKFNSGIFHGYDMGGHIDARISPGEYRVRPEIVTAIGGGSNKKGAATIEKLRRNLRKAKGVKSILPPKTKPLEKYIKMRAK